VIHAAEVGRKKGKTLHAGWDLCWGASLALYQLSSLSGKYNYICVTGINPSINLSPRFFSTRVLNNKEKIPYNLDWSEICRNSYTNIIVYPATKNIQTFSSYQERWTDRPDETLGKGLIDKRSVL